MIFFSQNIQSSTNGQGEAREIQTQHVVEVHHTLVNSISYTSCQIHKGMCHYDQRVNIASADAFALFGQHPMHGMENLVALSDIVQVNSCNDLFLLQTLDQIETAQSTFGPDL